MTTEIFHCTNLFLPFYISVVLFKNVENHRGLIMFAFNELRRLFYFSGYLPFLFFFLWLWFSNFPFGYHFLSAWRISFRAFSDYELSQFSVIWEHFLFHLYFWNTFSLNVEFWFDTSLYALKYSACFFASIIPYEKSRDVQVVRLL